MEGQVLAEFICKRQAAKQKIHLKERFWSTSIYWAKEYKKHIIAANSLLKVYSFSVIMRALQRKEAWWITSLRCKQLHDLCKEESIKESILNDTKVETVTYNTEVVPESGLAINNKLTKLRD